MDNSNPVIENQAEEDEEIIFTGATSSPVISSSSSLINDSPAIACEFTSERIFRLLKTDPTNHKVIKNTKNNLTSECWKVFGFPAKKFPLGEEFETIPGFVSCEVCFQTYTFTNTYGTRILNSHVCVQKFFPGTRKRSSSASATGYQMKLGTVMKCYKQVQLPEKEINLVKDLTCKWLCQDMRSFSIVEDSGLRNLLQEFILIGKHVSIYLFFLHNYFFEILRCYTWSYRCKKCVSWC